MVVYSFYLFNRNGTCLLYHEWKRPHQVHTADDDQKTMFGMLFALRNFSIKLSSTKNIHGGGQSVASAESSVLAAKSEKDDNTNSRTNNSSKSNGNSTAAMNPSATSTFDGVIPGMPKFFITDTYALHYYETLTGLRFVLTTSNDFGDLDVSAHLSHIYANIFVQYVVNNPLYTPLTPITIPAFTTKLDNYVRQLPCF